MGNWETTIDIVFFRFSQLKSLFFWHVTLRHMPEEGKPQHA